jgi:hypothetical protein
MKISIIIPNRGYSKKIKIIPKSEDTQLVKKINSAEERNIQTI